MEKDTVCVHCYPSKTNHLENKVTSILALYIGTPFTLILHTLSLKKLLFIIGQYIKLSMFKFSLSIDHARLITTIDRLPLNNSILVFWDEAICRNLTIANVTIGGKQTQLFRILHHSKYYYFDRNPINALIKKFFDLDPAQYDDKSFFKKILLKNNFPCPFGKTFISRKNALRYGLKLGFPLVVKPILSSHSRHVSFNIQSIEELTNAIEIAKILSHQILVEQHISGDVYRAVILDKRLIACARREPCSITGNGKYTIDKLIDEKNKQPWRENIEQLNATLYKIEKNKKLVHALAKLNLTLKSTLTKGRKIFLAHKVNLRNAADITDVTTTIHPENKLLLEKIHRVLNVPLSGFDFICSDISLPWHAQAFAVIEFNSLPDLSMHHYPSSGMPINVANLVWDFVLANTI